MKIPRGAFLVFLLLVVVLALPIQTSESKSLVKWDNRFTEDVDYGNGTHTSVSSIGPQVFWNGQEWQTLKFEDHSDQGYYLLENAQITVQVYGWYARYFDPDYQRICVESESWDVQCFQNEAWKSVLKPSAKVLPSDVAVIYNETGIWLTLSYSSLAGQLRITYILMPSAFLEHEVTFTSNVNSLSEFRVILAFQGIKSDVVSYGTHHENVTLKPAGQQSSFSFGQDRNNLVFTENLLSLENGTLQGVVFSKLGGSRADVIIGNYMLSLGQQLFIDPTSSSWQISNTSNDGGFNGYSTWSTILAQNRIGVWSTAAYIYVRFTSVNIAKGSTINSACFSENVYSAGTNVKTKSYGIAEDDTADFSGGDPSGRALTSAHVEWDFTGHSAGSWYNSSDISTEIGEITSRSGWASGHALGLKWTDSGSAGYTVEYAYDYSCGTPSWAIKLYVTWTSGETNIPTYSNAANDVAYANASITMSVLFHDDTNVSGWSFCWNSSGAWTGNTTWVAFTTYYNATSAWANCSKVASSTVGLVIGWQIWCNDSYNNKVYITIQTFTTTFYSSLNVVTTTHSWTINPGDVNQTLTSPTYKTINITVTAYVTFKVQAEGSGALSDGAGHTIALSNIRMANGAVTTSISVTTGFQDIPGLTGQGPGSNVALTFVLWASCPSPQFAGTYSYTLTLQIVAG